jgi:predicted nucleic acid-binding protein
LTVVDSSVWIDALDGRMNSQTIWLLQNLELQELSLVDLVLCEVLQGVGDDKQYRQAVYYLSRFPVHETGGAKLALASAGNYRLLRIKGVTVRKTIDCIIATFCIREGYALLHRDRDFDGFERHLGLQVIHPETT